MQGQRAESVYAAGAARAAGLGLGSGALELGLWGPCHSISDDLVEVIDMRSIRRCEKPECTYTVQNGITKIADILQAMTNHLHAVHPATGGGMEEEGVGGLQQVQATLQLS